MANNATVLSSFKFVAAHKRDAASDRVTMLREKMVAALKTQIVIAEHDRDGKHYKTTIRRFEGEGEDRKEVMKDGRVLRWFWTVGGNMFVEPRYGTSPLALNPQGHPIQAGAKIQDVISVLDKLIKATESGELDTFLDAASKKRARKPKA